LSNNKIGIKISNTFKLKIITLFNNEIS